MKKFLVLLLIFMTAFTLSVRADSIRAGALASGGRPTMLLKDTSVLGTYPGALQMFPNALWIKTTPGAGTYSVGVAYKVNDLAALATTYASANESTFVTIPGLGIRSINNTQHIYVLYGLKLGNLYAGLMVMNYFPRSTILRQTINSSSVVEVEESTTGFKTTIKPSAVLKFGSISVYGTVDATVNMNKYTYFTNSNTNSVTVTPSVLNNIGLDVTAAYDWSKDTTFGLTLGFSYGDTGYKVEEYTNTTDKSLTTNYNSTVMNSSIILGARTKAGADVELFFDMPMGFGVSKSGWESGTTTTIMTITLPTISAGAEVKLGKGFAFRLSGVPSWTRTITDVENSNSSGTHTVVDSYGLSSALGLGWHKGNFYINTTVNGTIFATDTGSPLAVLGGLFTGAAQQYFTAVQINYVW